MDLDAIRAGLEPVPTDDLRTMFERERAADLPPGAPVLGVADMDRAALIDALAPYGVTPADIERTLAAIAAQEAAAP